ncbi:hypothetical protein [Alicycliphilus denitrificans]|uniref:hypothetical protein n=1 Tax=Alicycliphilus denitrificans TaxID=179636 RepID=UPI0001D9F2F0|nr:hypothetical protein [Alicycliphilus denitrificans]ADU99490.1 hypothetical protein Alide_1738 [Alicycliphilus denitrificans BC]GAO22757.1 hypothetical protein ALISP_2577 [Alicycliphilus sp. B1]
MTPLAEPDLRRLAAEAAARPRCADCAGLQRPGWESISGATNTAHLECLGPLGTEADWDRLDEYHPHGTNLWSPDAPIALGWHPYTRCALWRCPRCPRCAGAYLRYTEYGGYYEEERIRPLRSELIASLNPP